MFQAQAAAVAAVALVLGIPAFGEAAAALQLVARPGQSDFLIATQLVQASRCFNILFT